MNCSFQPTIGNLASNIWLTRIQKNWNIGTKTSAIIHPVGNCGHDANRHSFYSYEHSSDSISVEHNSSSPTKLRLCPLIAITSLLKSSNAMFLHRLKLPRLALLFGAITRRAASVQVFASPDSLSTAIPIECRTALSNNITCPAPLINANRLLSGEATNDTFAEQYCDCSCTDSLKVRQSVNCRLICTILIVSGELV